MPDAGADLSMRAGPSSRKQQPDPTEARLANAEKEVAVAFETFAYDELIDVATEALNLKHGQEHVPPSKATIKSRKALLWARSLAYHHQDRHEQALKDAKAALKLDPHDIAAYLRAAVLLSSTGHKAQAFSCLNTAQSLSLKCETRTKVLWLRRIDKQRRKVSGSSWRLTDRLPSELMVEIAFHLDVLDRTSMSQTCRSWRHILVGSPGLWTSLSIKTNSKVLNANKASSLLQYISMRAGRSKHALESVVIEDTFPPSFLEKVVKILRASANTLEQLHIPAYRDTQGLLYARLYRFCPQLKYLNYPDASYTYIPDFEMDQSIAIPAVMDEDGAGLSQLERFDNAIGAFSFQLHDRFHKLRILKLYNPFEVHPENGVLKFDDEQMATGILENLEEWEFREFRQTERLGNRPCPAEFIKLTKLSGFIVQANCVLESTFPCLLELEISLQESGRDSTRELIRILRTSPKLRSLALGPCFQGGTNQYAGLGQALSRLQSLQRLDVRADDYFSVAELLMPQPVTSPSGKLEVTIPLPQLDYIIVNAQCTNLHKLAISLLVREHLRTGCTLTVARQMASDRLSTLPKKQTTVSPFQRGSNSAADATAPSLEIIEGPCLDDPATCSRLQRVEVTNTIGQVPEHIKLALESVCVDVVIKYNTLW